MIPVESKTIPENILHDSVLANIAAAYFSVGKQLERKTRCSSTRGFILSTLRGGASLNQNQIATQLGFDRTVVHRAIKSLVQEGLVSEKKAPSGRAILVSLSAKGNKYRERLIEMRIAADQKVRAALTSEERSTLLQLLQRIAALGTATGCVIAAEDVAAELGLDARMRLVDFSFAGVDPEVMGIGPVPATERVLARNDLTIDDIGLIEINEAFAVQVLAFLEHFKIADDDPRVNPWGGAIALGHPLASSGVRLMIQLAREFAEQPDARFGLTTMCVGLGVGGTVLWENLNA